MVDKTSPGAAGTPSGLDAVDWALLESLASHPRDLVRHVAGDLGLSRQAVHKHLSALIEAGWIEARGTTRARIYAWKPVVRLHVSPALAEDRIWREHLDPRLAGLPPNVQALLHYSASEMINNVIDHSGAREMAIVLRPLRETVEIDVEDDGEGIFRKLVRVLGLEDPRHAVLELSKGKLTTDPVRHTGEGIFFTCRMCDRFLLWSDDVCFGRVEGSGFLVTDAPAPRPGTTVRMVVRRDTTRTTAEVFDRFASETEDYGFTRTAVAVGLARHEGESLVSRSQARRCLARTDRFHEVVLDFSGVDSVGPAFADEVFRVFQNEHPDIVLRWEHASPEVERMILKARRQLERGDGPAAERR
jgi:DNA-binding Lrp family transcriptional regulator